MQIDPTVLERDARLMLLGRQHAIVVGTLLCLGKFAVAQPVVSGSGSKLRTDCATNDLLKWNGTTWVCSGGPAVTGSGATNVIAKWTSGFVLGQSSITDDGTTITVNGVTTVKAGTATAANAPAGTVLMLDQANGTSNYLYIRGNTSKYLAFGNASNALDGGLSYDQVSRGLGLLSANAHRMLLDSNGTIFAGDTANTAVADNVDVLTIGNTGTGQTVGSKAVIAATSGGTYDTTAGALEVYGINLTASSTRSAGANNLTNTALAITASGAQINRGVYVDASGGSINNNYALYANNGRVLVRDAVFITNDINNGRSRVLDVLFSNFTNSTFPTMKAGLVQLTGTFDTTGAGIETIAFEAGANSTRQTGSNVLTNVGVNGTANNGQALIGIRGTTAGSAVTNYGVYGTATGGAGATNYGGYFTASGGSNNWAVYARSTSLAASASQAFNADTAMAIETADGVNSFIGFRSTGQAGMYVSTASATKDVGVTMNTSGVSRGITLRTGGDIARESIDSNGGIWMGDTSISAVADNIDVLTVGNTGTGQTTTGKAELAISNTGSYSTAGGNVTYYGANIAVSATESAGANTLSAVALRASATNGDERIAGYFHTGNSSGLATALTGTAMVLEQANGTAAYFQFRSNTTAGLAWAGAGTGGDGKLIYDQSTNTMQFATSNAFRQTIDNNGSVFLGDTSSTAISDNVDVLTINNTGTGQTVTGKSLLTMSNTGSYNTTSGATTAAGIFLSLTSTRSAGANNLTNKALIVNSSGAQTNLAIETDAGDNRFNFVSGSSQFYGPLTIGDANSDVLTITSTIESDAKVYYSGTAPTLSGCAVCTMASYSTNERGTITCTDGPNACTVTFANGGYTTNAPSCVVSGTAITGSPASSATYLTSAPTTTAFTVSTSVAGAKTITYHCDGMI